MNRIGSILLLCAAGWSFGAQAEVKLTYKPPQLGAPDTRVGSGSRGLSGINRLAVLAPPHTALTATPQPALYWQIATSEPQQVEISLIRDGIEQPLLEKHFTLKPGNSIQALRLADEGITLQAGIEYRWSVALIADPEQRSADLVSSATLRFQPPATPLNTPQQQAEAGYWYDALAGLVETQSPQLQDFLRQGEVQVENF